MSSNPMPADSEVEDDAKIPQFIAEWADERGLKQKDVVKFTGADKGLVSKWFKKSVVPRGAQLKKLALLFEIEVHDLFTDPQVRKAARAAKAAELGAAVEIREFIPVEGYVAASTWQELDELGQEPKRWIPFVPDGDTRRHFAVEVRGNSMDKLIKDGDDAIAVEDFSQIPRDGDIVVIRRVRGPLIERTLKVYRETVRGAVFMPESTDPRHEPIPAVGEDGTSIEIEGFVVGYYGSFKRR